MLAILSFFRNFKQNAKVLPEQQLFLFISFTLVYNKN